MLGDREDRIANAILNSKVTLGTMVTALEVACNADSALGKQLDRFLTQRHWPLRVHLRSKKALDRLRTATDSRNRAAHGSDITPEEARQVYLEARAILDVLAKNGSDIGRVK
jgi:hypothetical protein